MAENLVRQSTGIKQSFVLASSSLRRLTSLGKMSLLKVRWFRNGSGWCCLKIETKKPATVNQKIGPLNTARRDYQRERPHIVELS